MAKMGLGPSDALNFHKQVGPRLPEDWYKSDDNNGNDLPTFENFIPWFTDNSLDGTHVNEFGVTYQHAGFAHDRDKGPVSSEPNRPRQTSSRKCKRYESTKQSSVKSNSQPLVKPFEVNTSTHTSSSILDSSTLIVDNSKATIPQSPPQETVYTSEFKPETEFDYLLEFSSILKEFQNNLQSSFKENQHLSISIAGHSEQLSQVFDLVSSLIIKHHPVIPSDVRLESQES
ncbi:hypothetical protein EAI_15639 [Harpegnathos saltator]|uniref:Uncharacterized protein n=1 Tax=Harpegnathos saltator TaxID=610380 RepID=E2B6L4_HARSA|nr:hypothetical protein EAI_15639 [Harpegnathos saltator]